MNMDIRNVKADIELAELQTKTKTYHNIYVLENKKSSPYLTFVYWTLNEVQMFGYVLKEDIVSFSIKKVVK